MNFLKRKNLIKWLDQGDYELARQQLSEAGFDIWEILSFPIFDRNTAIAVDSILSDISIFNNVKPISGSWGSGFVSMVDYGSLDGWRQAKKI